MSKKAATESVRERQVSASTRAPAKPKPRTVARDSTTGRLTTKQAAKANPKGTEVETIKAKPAKLSTKVPKSMAACADLLYTTRQDRLALQKTVDALEGFEKALKAHVIDNLPKSSATGAAGKVARVQVVSEDVPQVKDWEKLYAHIKKTNSFDLLNRALNKKAVEARWDNKKKVPGVEEFKVVKVSVTKL